MRIGKKIGPYLTIFRFNHFSSAWIGGPLARILVLIINLLKKIIYGKMMMRCYSGTRFVALVSVIGQV